MPQGPSFWFDIRVYLAVAATMLMVIVFYNKYVAILGAILLLALYLYGRERYHEHQKAFTAYIDTMAYNVCGVTSYALQNLPMAMAIIDNEGRLKWFNNLLSEWVGQRLNLEESLLKAWPDFPLSKILTGDGQQVFNYDSKHYQINYRSVHHGTDSDLIVLYITDITTVENVKAECHAAMPVVAYIQIDNHDDVLQGLNDSQRSAILLEVNKLLTEWLDGLDGFMKKYNKDTYFAVFSKQALDIPLQDKFEILDKVRMIKGGNKIPVTLSMGVATDNESFSKLAERAQAGLDLALGRGGDQVTVHLGGKIHFFGGKTKAVEKHTRVKARIVSQVIKESISVSESVLVMGHVNEDFDSLGAALGVAKMARYAGKKAHVVVSTGGVALSKLAGIVEGYEDYKDIFVYAAEAMQLVTKGTLLFLVDTHRPEMAAVPELLEKVEKVIVLDHHRRSEGIVANALLLYLEPSASSTSELVTELLMYFDDKLDLSRIEATALYAGIVIDTKSFVVQTGVRTFDAAAYLRRAGADPALVRHLFRMDFDTFKTRAEIIANTNMLPGGMIIAACPDHIRNNCQIAAAQAADMLLRIDGVRLCFVLYSLEDGVGISARSNGDVNVQIILEEMGGGGHQTAAGAQIKNATIAEVRQRLLDISANYIKESDSNESTIAARS